MQFCRMEESIKLSAAGRSVMVGDFYDYSSDQVITLGKFQLTVYYFINLTSL